MDRRARLLLMIGLIIISIIATNIFIVFKVFKENRLSSRSKEIELQEPINEENMEENSENDGGEIFGTTGTDIKEVKKSNPVEREVIRNTEKKSTDKEEAIEQTDMPKIYDLVKGEWVALVSGFKQEKRYLVLEGNTYKETLGNKLLMGGRVDMASDPSEERSGTYKFNVSKGKWSGDIIFDNGVTSRFIYGEIEGGEPFLDIIPGLTLIRRDFQEDYMNDPDFIYPTPKD